MKLKWVLQSLFLLLLAVNFGCQSTGERTPQSPALQRNLYNVVIKENLVKAEKGDAEAQYNIGNYFGRGESLIFYENYVEASKWLKLSAAQGYEKAKTLLTEIEQREAKQRNVFEGFRAKAESGDAAAQENLGECYYEGEGVAKDA